jgi:hypothetical protein
MACGLMFAPRRVPRAASRPGRFARTRPSARTSGKARADDAVDDAEAEQAVRLTSMATVLVRRPGSYASGTAVPRLPEDQAAAATSANAAASIPHSRRCRCLAQHGSQDSLGSPAQRAQTSCVQGHSSGRSHKERPTDTHLARRATVLQTQRKVPSDDLLSPAELESHDHTFGTRPFDAVET